MKSNPAVAALVAAMAAVGPLAAGPKLQYVVVVARHGVRSPTWDAERLNRYSSQPWPGFGVAPGELTPHGRTLIRILGSYYREWLTGEGLLSPAGCGDADRIYIWADTDQRTLETGRALAESLVPGCGLAVHSQPERQKDPVFGGAGRADPELAARAVRERLGPGLETAVAEHAAAFAALEFILTGKDGPGKPMDSPAALAGPFATGSTLSENLLLEYTNGMRGADLGWGRLTKENLYRALELHAVYADLTRRAPYLASVHSSNLLAHVLRSMEQSVSGAPVPGALGRAGDALLVLSGHDTNLSNISGMLGLSWHLPGYQPDDTPPGGALVFSLWRETESGEYRVRTQYLAQTLDQMHDAERLTKAAPPASQEVAIPGCASGSPSGCSWQSFRQAVQQAIDPRFTTIDTGLPATASR